ILIVLLTFSSSKSLTHLVTYYTVSPKRYRTGPLLSLSTIALPGVYSVIVPVPSVVVVVVVVVSETCPHANGATIANAMLKSVFFRISLACFSCFGDKLPVYRLHLGSGRKSLPPY